MESKTTRSVGPLMGALPPAAAPTSVGLHAAARLLRICSSVVVAVAVFVAVAVGVVLDVPGRAWDE